MFFTFIAMSARAKWQDAPEQFRGVAARGWFLGRWIPTFLIVDGPVGRFVLSKDSPLAMALEGGHAPLLASVRSFLDDRTFRLLRNGFAHWAFDWDVVGPDSYVVAYDWERDLPTAKLHLEEATTVFGDLLAMNMPDPDHSEGEQRYLVLGMSGASRLVVVSYAERPPRTRIISARLATSRERREYENEGKKTRG